MLHLRDIDQRGATLNTWGSYFNLCPRLEKDITSEFAQANMTQYTRFFFSLYIFHLLFSLKNIFFLESEEVHFPKMSIHPSFLWRTAQGNEQVWILAHTPGATLEKPTSNQITYSSNRHKLSHKINWRTKMKGWSFLFIMQLNDFMYIIS